MIRFRPLPVLTLWFVPALAILVGLGAWQVQRLHWKQDLIARVEQRMAAPADALADALSDGLAAAEWRHVHVQGRFLHGKEIFLFAPSRAGEPGYHVVTPLVLENENSVLIDRGFVPENLKNPAVRNEGQIAGDVTVSGVVRLSQPPGMFTPAPDRINRIWFARDIPSMAEAAGERLMAPVVVEAEAAPNPGGYPIGGQTRTDFRNEHLQYAITWFGLAFVLTVIYLLYHHRQGRLQF